MTQSTQRGQTIITLFSSLSDIFSNFEEQRIDVSNADIYLEMGGDDPPLLLLHGFPQTHVTWHKIAPRLAEQYTVIAPDLRGYGESIGPSDPETVDYTHRAMAAVMETLEFDEYRLVRHDRGARVGYRFALDFPRRIQKLAVLDIVPTLDTAELEWIRDGKTFSCPWHGWEYDITSGECLSNDTYALLSRRSGGWRYDRLDQMIAGASGHRFNVRLSVAHCLARRAGYSSSRIWSNHRYLEHHCDWLAS